MYSGAKPSLLMKGVQPSLIDEWQYIPVVWDAVRIAVDNYLSSSLSFSLYFLS